MAEMFISIMIVAIVRVVLVYDARLCVWGKENMKVESGHPTIPQPEP